MYLHYIFHIEKQFIWSFIATNPVKTNASLLFTLAKFQVFCSDADDHHTKAATSTTARHIDTESFFKSHFLISSID